VKLCKLASHNADSIIWSRSRCTICSGRWDLRWKIGVWKMTKVMDNFRYVPFDLC